MKKIILSLFALLLLNTSINARYTCCIDTQDTVMCTQLESLKECNEVCPNMCVDIADDISGDVVD